MLPHKSGNGERTQANETAAPTQQQHSIHPDYVAAKPGKSLSKRKTFGDAQTLPTEQKNAPTD